MKYLKLFDAANVSTDPLYFLISPDEYYSYSHSYIKFSESEIQEMSQVAKDSEKEIDFNDYGFLFRDDHLSTWIAHKLEDEYYLVLDDSRVYKCDQWDGLLKCLDYLLN